MSLVLRVFFTLFTVIILIMHFQDDVTERLVTLSYYEILVGFYFIIQKRSKTIYL